MCEILTPEEKLNVAIESFEILKDNLDNFSIKEQLEMASSIRDNLSADECLIAGCVEDTELSTKRMQLLDRIHKLQMDLIQENIKKDEEISFSSCRVIDFDKAKMALVKMIDDELASNIFERAELTSLFKSIKECEAHNDTLKRVSSDCKFGKYKVLIMGDFQSGKSTTLDAFCDGRHICAIGRGTATSAVPVYATYSEKESMTIHWRQKNQFIVIFDKIKQYLQNFDWESFDLDEFHSREDLFNAIELLRNSTNCPNVGEGDAKFLMLCSFILVYYGTRELQEKKSSLQFISEISNITKFPDNGESIWEKSGIEKFTIDDALFIFIDYVECFIPSSTLKELNCTVIDSPGLFNSSYDTMVTETAMKEAHAIMYILPYHKGIGMDECKSLYTIKNNYSDVHRKLFIVNNLILTDDNEFYDSNCRQIKSMFGPQKHVYQYDGRLAYLTQLKKLYSLGLALDKDYSYLMSVAKKGFSGVINNKTFNDFDDAWAYHTKKYELEDTHLEEVLEICGFKGITNALKQFIADNESYAVIVSNGLHPMRNELISVKNSLFRSYIEPYISSHEDLVRLWENRINIANAFQEHVRKEAEKKLFSSQNGHRSLHERMAEEEYLKLFTEDFYTELSEAMSGALYDNKHCLLLQMFDKTEFKKIIAEWSSPWIKYRTIELVRLKMGYLVDNMERQIDETVENMFTPVIDNFEKELQEYWSNEFGEDKDVSLKDYMILPRSLKLSRADESNQAFYESSILSDYDVRGTLLRGLIEQSLDIIAGIASKIADFISAILESGAMRFVVAVLLGLDWVIKIFAPDAIRNKFIKILSKEIYSYIRANEVEGFKRIVGAHLKNTLNKYIDNLSFNINKLQNERDLALNPNHNQETLCFKAIDANIRINSQIGLYDDYKKDFLKDETI